MGWIARLIGASRRGSDQASPSPTTLDGTAHASPTEAGWQPPPGGYAVVDVETTGLSPQRNRVVAVAVVLLDAEGEVQQEWTTLVDPQGPVGATHIHGIRDEDVIGAPRFDSLVQPMMGMLAGRAVVGHNVSFDLSFLKFEFGRAGWSWPDVPALCTLDESFHYLPALDRRRLVDCCSAAGIQHTVLHSALHDARATAQLFASYLTPRPGVAHLAAHSDALTLASEVSWPPRPGVGQIAIAGPPARALSARALKEIAAAASRRPSALLETFTLSDALDDGAPEGALSYLETLTEVLEDGAISLDERAALEDIAALYGLDHAKIAASHRGFVRALAREAIEDGVLSRQEKAELHHVARLLDVPVADVSDLLDGEAEARLIALSANLAPLPSGWSYGTPLRVGERIAVTGCEDAGRDSFEARARSAGLRIGSSVTRRTALLVTDGTVDGGKAAAAASFGLRCVHPSEFKVLLSHIQPALAADRGGKSNASPKSRAAVTGNAREVASKTSGPTPSAVRAWASTQGYDVGVRGRLSADVWTAYGVAHGSVSNCETRSDLPGDAVA